MNPSSTLVETGPRTAEDPQSTKLPHEGTAAGSARPPRLAVTSARIIAWAVPAASSFALLLIRNPLAVAPLALTLAASWAAVVASPQGGLPRHRMRPLSLVAALPAGVTLVVVTALSLGVLGGLLGLPVWADRAHAVGATCMVLVLTGTLSWRRGGRVTVVGHDWAALCGAALLAAFFCWVVASRSFAVWSREMASGTDFLRHVGMSREVRESGLLEPGAISSPHAFHAVVAWLSSALGVDTGADALWRAAQPLAMVLLVVMLLAVMAGAERAAALCLESRGASLAAAVVAGAAFIQTAWFSTFLALGSVMNMLVAVGLLAMLVTGASSRSGSLVAGGVAGAAVAVTANAWQLVLPIAALGCLPWVLGFLRRRMRDPRQWGMWIWMGVLSLHGLLGLRTTSVVGAVSTPTVSNLFAPDWWWFASLGLGGLTALVAHRSGQRIWAASAAGMCVGVVALTGYLVVASGSSWELMRYYPVKAMWTGLVVVVPLAAAGAVVLVAWTWRVLQQRGSTVRLVLRTLVAAVVILVLVGVAGRGAAFRPHLVVMATTGTGVPNWSLAVVDAMGPVQPSQQPTPIVMGVVPAANVPSIQGGFVGMADYMGMEALAHVGLPQAAAAPVKLSLASRDMREICGYLRANPAALRITGPNPAAGPGWLLDSGCPQAVVQPARWILLQFDPAWLQRSAWEDPTLWTYPTVAEVTAARQ